MDYRHQERLKIWGRAKYIEGDIALLERLKVPNYKAEVERAIVFEFEACSWNCSQHIPVRYSDREVASMVTSLENRITELEEKLTKYESSMNP